jgi:parvulin-like peptidyl-prolyl isomerase
MKCLLIFALLASTPIFAADPDAVVATVNGKDIKFSTFDQTYKQDFLYVSDKKVTKDKVLYDLINRELGLGKAQKENLANDPTVKYKMDDVLYHAQVSKDLEPLLKKIKVSDGEAESYYKTHTEYRTAHILFRMRAQPDQNETEAALAQALKIREALRKEPDKFAQFADKFSQSSTAPSGGDLGFQPAVMLAPEYFAAINGKAVGFITDPVRTQFGYHIIKVIGVKSFKDVDAALYKKLVYDQKRDAIIENYFAEMRKNAKIVINKDFLK